MTKPSSTNSPKTCFSSACCILCKTMSWVYVQSTKYNVQRSNIRYFPRRGTVTGNTWYIVLCTWYRKIRRPSAGVPPLPIPNREVKPCSADGTGVTPGRVGRRHIITKPARKAGFWRFWVCVNGHQLYRPNTSHPDPPRSEPVCRGWPPPHFHVLKGGINGKPKISFGMLTFWVWFFLVFNLLVENQFFITLKWNLKRNIEIFFNSILISIYIIFFGDFQIFMKKYLIVAKIPHITVGMFFNGIFIIIS